MATANSVTSAAGQIGTHLCEGKGVGGEGGGVRGGGGGGLEGRRTGRQLKQNRSRAHAHMHVYLYRKSLKRYTL